MGDEDSPFLSLSGPFLETYRVVNIFFFLKTFDSSELLSSSLSSLRSDEILSECSG